MISDDWQIYQTTHEDHVLLSGLLDAARWKHQHFDWIPPADLLDQQPFLIAEDHGLPIGCLGCPSDLPGISWIHVFAAVAEYERNLIWTRLWESTRKEAANLGIDVVLAISSHDWMTELLLESEFKETNRVIFMEWNDHANEEKGSHMGSIRQMQEEDVPAVQMIDSKAFQPAWRHSETALRAALRRTALARVYTVKDEIKGYQLSTANAFAVHLARVAVDPDWQGKGIATTLVLEVLDYSRHHGQSRVTVNTQADNLRSQDLYRRLGFRSSEQEFPLLEVRLG